MTARPDHDGDEAGRCGGCGSRNLVAIGSAELALCLGCQRLQEPETRDFPEAKMCNNCAFRKGSPERADPFRWAEVMATFDRRQPFHCHKGLAATVDLDTGHVEFTAPNPATGRVTVCAGWLAVYVARLNAHTAALDLEVAP